LSGVGDPVKRSTIRGVKIIQEPYMSPDRVPENLRYEIDVYDDRDYHVECLGRLHDLDAAIAAFEACCRKYPAKRIFLRDLARVIRSSEQPDR
jgi:hypothetical protein